VLIFTLSIKGLTLALAKGVGIALISSIVFAL